MLALRCPNCRRKLSVPSHLAGRRVRCPACAQIMRVPIPQQSGASATASAESPTLPRMPSAAAAEPQPSTKFPPASHVMPAVAAAVASTTIEQPSPYSYLAPPQAADEIGRLGGYRILKALGEGGMGVVFLAEDPRLKRKIALKVMKPEAAAQPQSRQRFVREAQNAAALVHDHVITIYQVGEDRGIPFLAMPVLKGESLDVRLEREGRLVLPEVLRISREIAEGLAAAHDVGLIHRDIKPANVWLEAPKARVKLLDFGLARANVGDEKLTQSGTILGTPAYMAPEQARNQMNIDHRADLFSLGTVMYEMSTGVRPFQGNDPLAVITSLALDDPPPPTVENSLIPEELSDLIMQLLSKKPEDRPSHAHHVVEQLRRLEPLYAPRPLSDSGRMPKASLFDAPTGRSWPRAMPPVLPTSPEESSLLGELVKQTNSNTNNAAEEDDDPQSYVWATVLHETPPNPSNPTVSGSRLPAHVAEGVITLAGHQGDVTAVAFHPEGKLVATGCADRLVRLWHAEDGREHLVLRGHVGPITALAFSPEGKHLLSASGGIVKIWDIATGSDLMTLTGHSDFITAADFSPDGRLIATTSADQSAKLWDRATGKEIRTLLGHSDYVTALAFRWDGSRLATASADQTIIQWDVHQGTRLQTSQGHQDFITALAYSFDGRRLYSTSRDRTARIWDAETGAELGQITSPGWLTDVAVRPDDRMWIVVGAESQLGVRDPYTGQELFSLKPKHSQGLTSVAFATDGKRMITGSRDKTAKLWDLTVAQKPVQGDGHTDFVNCVAFFPDGQRIVSSSRDKSIRIWRASNGELLQTLQGHTDWVLCVSLNADGSRLVSGSDDRTVKIWDPHSGHELLTLVGHQSFVRSVAFSPDGKRIASGSADQTVRVWNATTGEAMLELHGHLGSVHAVAFGPNGKRIVSAGLDQMVRVWDLATGQEILTLQGHTDSVDAVVFSPDGKRIASASADRTVRLWDLATASEVMCLEGHTRSVDSVAFNFDGSRLVSGSGDRTIKVWDVRTGQELFSLYGHTRSVTSVAFSPDGNHIVSGSADLSVKVWYANW